MPYINNLAPTSELEAINEMLGSIGEAPVDSVDTALTDVQMAVSLLRRAAQDVQQKGWRFNTEIGYEVAPANTVAWPVPDYVTPTIDLNVFKVPDTLLGFTVTEVDAQQGSTYLDLGIRSSKIYTESGAPVRIFYDRELNRDGFLRDYLYINPVWALDFDHLPQVARSYISIQAARRFAQRVGGSAELSGFVTRDEVMALRDLKREEGLTDNLNIFQNASVSRFLGGRPFGASGSLDGRATPGPR